MKIGSAVIQAKNEGHSKLKNQRTDPSTSKIATSTTKPSLHSQSGVSSMLQAKETLKARDGMKHGAVHALVDQMTQKALMEEQLRQSPKFIDKNRRQAKEAALAQLNNPKKALPMGSCDFFLDPDRAATKTKKAKEVSATMDLGSANYQSNNSAQASLQPAPQLRLQRVKYQIANAGHYM